MKQQYTKILERLKLFQQSKHRLEQIELQICRIDQQLFGIQSKSMLHSFTGSSYSNREQWESFCCELMDTKEHLQAQQQWILQEQQMMESALCFLGENEQQFLRTMFSSKRPGYEKSVADVALALGWSVSHGYRLYYAALKDLQEIYFPTCLSSRKWREKNEKKLRKKDVESMV